MNKSALIFVAATASPACALGQAVPVEDKDLSQFMSGSAAQLGRDSVVKPDPRLPKALPALGLPPFAGASDGKFGKRLASYNFMMGENGRLRLGVLTEEAANADVLPTLRPYAKRRVISAQYEHRAGDFTAILGAGVLRESGSLLGSLQGSALAPDSAARTAFSTLALGYALTPSLALVGMASAGHTTFNGADSIGQGIAPARMLSYSAGLAGTGWLHPSDRFGLTLTMPARVTPVAVGLMGSALTYEDGSLGYGTRMLAFAPRGAERDMTLSYSRQVGKNERVSAGLMLRLNPGPDSGAPKELLLGLRYAKKF